MNGDPQVAANPFATNSLSEFNQSCVSHVTSQSKKSPMSNVTHSLLCCLVCSHGIIYLSTSTNLSSSTFHLCDRMALVGRSWRWHDGVVPSHTKMGDPCISNAHLNLLRPFFGLCNFSPWHNICCVSWKHKTATVYIKDVSLNTRFQNDSKHIANTSRQCTLCWKNFTGCVFPSWTLWKNAVVVMTVAFPISPNNG